MAVRKSFSAGLHSSPYPASKLNATCASKADVLIGRNVSKLVVWFSSSSTPAWSRSDTGGNSITATRSGKNGASPAASAHVMTTPGAGEEYGINFLAPLPAATRRGSTESRDGIHAVALLGA